MEHNDEETPSWEVRFLPDAQNELLALQKPIRTMILTRIMGRLQTEPMAYGKLLKKPLHPLYRLRVDDHRVVYQVNERAQIVTIVAVGIRRDIYREAEILVGRLDDAG